MSRSKLKKFAELKTFPNVLEKGAAVKLKGKWQKDFFQNKKKILIEVGCGHGVFALEVAKKFSGI